MANVRIGFVIYILLYNFSFLNNNSFSKGLNSRNCSKSNEKSVMITQSKKKKTHTHTHTQNHKQTKTHGFMRIIKDQRVRWNYLSFIYIFNVEVPMSG